MKCTIPEISWHNRDPVLSLDIQPIISDGFYRLASGGTDSHVLIWHLKILETGATNIEAVCDLTRHQRAVNVVRWSPSGQYLASGDDDANIIIWQQKADDLAIMLDGDTNDKEKWSIFKVLRGHKEDVYDICWSPDSNKLLSGSVDNTAIIWDLAKGLNDNILKDHKGFVQGVTWDPLGQYLATLSSDRTCRIFNDTGKQVKARISKGNLPVPESHALHGQSVRYYHDDTLKSFFRRLTFSPDGNLIITPAGCLEIGPTNKHLYTTYIFTTHNLNEPAAILPSPNQYTIAVKFCPILFKLQSNGPDPTVVLPYRMVFAVATRSSVLLYDTQQTTPFGVISNIHYTRLTDVTWSNDGRMLAVSSTDGFCSLVTFEPDELGVEYVREDDEEEIIETIVQEDEIFDTSVSILADEKKEKRPSFLEQWTKKTAASKEIKMDVDNDVIEHEKENKNKENVIDDEKKKDQVETPKKDGSKSKNKKDNKETPTKQDKDTFKSPYSSSPARPIAVRKKPRDQMNITQFLKSPITTATTSTAEKQQNEEQVLKTFKAMLLKQETIKNEEKTESDQCELISDKHSEDTSSSAITVFDDIIEIDDSQDIKLVLDDSQDENACDKMDIDKKLPEPTELKIVLSRLNTENYKTSSENSITNEKKDCNLNKNSTSDEKMLVDEAEVRCDKTEKSKNCQTKDKNVDSSSENSNGRTNNDKINQTAEAKTSNSVINTSLPNKDVSVTKKRIPFITLSSPKQKKRPLN